MSEAGSKIYWNWLGIFLFCECRRVPADWAEALHDAIPLQDDQQVLASAHYQHPAQLAVASLLLEPQVEVGIHQSILG